MNNFRIELHNLTDDKIDDVIQKARKAQLGLILGIPATQQGLNFFWSHFRCTRCGKCCDGTITGPKGETFIALREADLRRLKGHMKAKKLRRLCLRRDDGTLALSMPCHFYTPKPRPSCKIYNARPDICRNYPLEMPVLDHPTSPPAITGDPYCQGVCNLFRDLLISEATDYKGQLDEGSKSPN